MSPLTDKTILITGGTGSFGNAFCKYIIDSRIRPKKIIIFSRDEYKQSIMKTKFPDTGRFRYFIGDVRDPKRLHRAFAGVDIVIHAAALKRIEVGEYDPSEMIMTNIVGGINVIDAAIDHGVDKVMFLSTDKAVDPINLYGATKMCAEKVCINGNNYVGERNTKMSVVRYGNVFGSRGSVIDIWNREAPKGEIAVTKPFATRFVIQLQDAVEFIIKSIEDMKGGEIFIPPDLKAVSMDDVAEAYREVYTCRIKTIDLASYEKVHEKLDEGYTSDKAERLSVDEIIELIS